MNQIIRFTSEKSSESIGSYSQGISIPLGNLELLFLTGQIALNENGELMYPNDTVKQAEYIFENIQHLLAVRNCTLVDVVKVVIYITNIEEFKSISEIRNKYLEISRPVSTLVEVNKLAIPNATIEIEVTAIKNLVK